MSGKNLHKERQQRQQVRIQQPLAEAIMRPYQERLQGHQQAQQQAQRSEYDSFFQEVSDLSQFQAEGDLGQQSPKNKKKVGSKEHKRRKKIVKKMIQENKKSPHLVEDEEKKELAILLQTKEGKKSWENASVKETSLTRKQVLQNILERKDYSQFELLDDLSRNLVATKALEDLIAKYQVNENTSPAALCLAIKSSGAGVSAILDPTMRLGLSLGSRSERFSPAMRKLFLDIDNKMSTMVMEETLTHVTDKEQLAAHFRQQGASDADEKAEQAIAKNKAEQIQIAKRLLLMQLSDFQKRETSGPKEDPTYTFTEWQETMATALSHCSRVMFTMPLVEEEKAENTQVEHKKMWQAIFTTNGENSAGDNARGSSTHAITRKEIGADHVVKKAAEERKVAYHFGGQRGMNCAVGGLGNAGVGGKILLNDGTCGHFYSMYEEGDATHHGGILMGMESDEYKKVNQMGHTHTLTAKGEKASSFGAQRNDEIGDKYGGRQANLTGYTATQITDWMQELESAMQKWQSSKDGMQDGDAYAVMQMLSGKKLSADELGALRKILRRVNGNPAA